MPHPPVRLILTWKWMTGIISRKLGVASMRKAALKSPDDPVEAVSVFVEGYYDSDKGVIPA
jgi:hypothetical protein